MSATALLWSSSPIMLGRPSSPLNPHATSIPSSSSPLTSPTPGPSQLSIRPFQLSPSDGSPRSRSYIATPNIPLVQTRYTRPNAKRAQTSPSSMDFFAEGTTPVEGAMWKEKFSRRVADRERRKHAREDDLNRRRSVGNELDDISPEEELKRKQEDDEEMFRRVIVHQRRRANAQMSEWDDTADFDILEAEYWEEERLSSTPRNPTHDGDQLMPSSPQGTPYIPTFSEEDRWAREAAEAEEAEREAEEAEAARRVEEAYWQQHESERMDLD